MPLYHSLKSDAIFIADAHYNKNRTKLSLLLDKIINNEIKTSQLFLMGDIFDFLCYEIKYFKQINHLIVNKINILSHKIEVIYLEGNHDFNLKNIFPNCIVIPRDKQAINFSLDNKPVILSHGDIYTPISYNIFTYIFRNRYILFFLNLIDINNYFSKKSENMLLNKKICNEFKDFDSFARNRIKKYNKDKKTIIIEGHYHQGKRYENYINIPSFACENIYTQIEYNSFTNKKFI